jgi:hypothetical protein
MHTHGNMVAAPKMRQKIGRVQRGVMRAFIVANGPITGPAALEWAYPRLGGRYLHKHRWSVRRALLRCATPLGRQGGHGRPMLWAPLDSL